MGAAKVPLAYYVICNDIAVDYEHRDDGEVRMYQMPDK
jgi:hypothetical protein